MEQEELERYDGVAPGKYTSGLGQRRMAFCGDQEDVVSISLTAVKRLLEKYNVDPRDIGRRAREGRPGLGMGLGLRVFSGAWPSAATRRTWCPSRSPP